MLPSLLYLSLGITRDQSYFHQKLPESSHPPWTALEQRCNVHRSLRELRILLPEVEDDTPICLGEDTLRAQLPHLNMQGLLHFGHVQ